jgi:hypothetical protein
MALLPSDLFDPDDPVFIIGGGPSISDMLLAPLRGLPMIAVNQAYKLFPEALMHFGADKRWWARERKEFLNTFKGKYVVACIDGGEPIECFPVGTVIYLHSYADKKSGYVRDGGLELEPTHLRGNNSGAFAINVAYHCGARLVVLLGFDMHDHKGRGHWYVIPNDTHRAPYERFYIPAMNDMAKDARKAGLRIVNATPRSALTCFETGHFEDFL